MLRLLSRTTLLPGAALALAAGPAGLPAAASTAESAAEPAGLGEVVEQVAEAYGGRERLAAFPGFRARGKVLALADGISGTLRISLALDGSLRVEIRYPHRTEIRILSGKLAWNGGRRRQRPSPARMADSVRLQYHRLAAPFELVGAPLDELRPLGASEEGWVRIERRWSDRIRTVYEVDAETGRIRRVRGEVGTGDGKLEFVSEVGDFREIGGILFPFRMTTMVGGREAAETLLDRITVEEDFSAEDFRPAGAKADI